MNSVDCINIMLHKYLSFGNFQFLLYSCLYISISFAFFSPHDYFSDISASEGYLKYNVLYDFNAIFHMVLCPIA